MQAGGARDALAVYPEMPLPENRGWGRLRGETALARLGRMDEARRVLGENAAVPEFRQHRRALANQLARGEPKAAAAGGGQRAAGGE
jgi:hypothetical protein